MRDRFFIEEICHKFTSFLPANTLIVIDSSSMICMSDLAATATYYGCISFAGVEQILESPRCQVRIYLHFGSRPCTTSDLTPVVGFTVLDALALGDLLDHLALQVRFNMCGRTLPMRVGACSTCTTHHEVPRVQFGSAEHEGYSPYQRTRTASLRFLRPGAANTAIPSLTAE